MSIPYTVWRQYLVPQHGLSRLAGLLGNNTYPALKNCLIKYFLKQYSVNMAEALEENPFAYSSFNAFFTRQLKPNARPMATDSNTIVSPADGTLYQYGKITQNTLLHAKNQCYTLSGLLGCRDDFADQFIDGYYHCVYLAPDNYHRVHMPTDGVLQSMRYVPGRLFSVNKVSAETIENIFARNERLIAFFKSPYGNFAVILVGAMIVGNIHTSWSGEVTSRNREILERDYREHPIHIKKGDEMGHFQLGSTVITLFDKNIALDDAQDLNHTILMGETIGHYKNDVLPHTPSILPQMR